MTKHELGLKRAIAQMAILSVVAAVVGIGLMGVIAVGPDKDLRLDPMNSMVVAFLGLSSLTGAIVSISYLRRGSDD